MSEKSQELKRLTQMEKKARKDLVDYFSKCMDMPYEKRKNEPMEMIIAQKKQKIKEICDKKNEILRSYGIVAVAAILSTATIFSGIMLFGKDKKGKQNEIPTLETSNESLENENTTEEQEEETTLLTFNKPEEETTIWQNDWETIPEFIQDDQGKKNNDEIFSQEDLNLEQSVDRLLKIYNSRHNSNIKIDMNNLSYQDILRLFKVQIATAVENQTSHKVSILDNIIIKHEESPDKRNMYRLIIIYGDGYLYRFELKKENGQIVINNMPQGLLRAFENILNIEEIEQELNGEIADNSVVNDIVNDTLNSDLDMEL